MRAFLLVVALGSIAGCGSNDAPERASPTPDGAGALQFVDRTDASGLHFTHFNGMTGDLYYPEVMAPGVALVDYDGDGDLDVFVVQGRMLDGVPPGAALLPPPEQPGARLFRNEGGLRFVDVTVAAGIGATGYGMGVATGDFDNDGCVDLYVTNLGANQLLRNRCDGTFTDVTARSGTADPGWSVSAAFVDVDRDGWLDLFVGQYLDYTVAGNVRCFSLGGQPDYCPPDVYRARPSHLFRNNRDGTFTDVTAASGMAREFGPALGVSTADFNGDGWIDLFVANDGAANQLWINQRDGRFVNTALLAGTAVTPEGVAKASMGVDAGDFDGDGDDDLVIGELQGQGADLYVNDGAGVFTEEGARLGLRLRTLPFTGFGAAWFDADNDGLLDLAIVNGAVTQSADALAGRRRFALEQRRQIFRNSGHGFEELTDRAGSGFAPAEVGRGAAFGDVDNDGDTDIVVANANGPLRLLVNETPSGHHWIGLRLLGRDAPRDMLGARVAIAAGARTLWRRARSDGSYASANDPRVLAGLGTRDGPVRLTVHWPDGTSESWDRVEADRYTTIVQGRGPVGPGRGDGGR